MRKPAWVLFAVLCLSIGFYPLLYLLIGGKIALLQFKDDTLLGSRLWRFGFYTHVVTGGMALLVGWTQFVKSLRTKNLHLHRALGKLYVVMVCISGVAAFCLSFFASAGWIAGLGFGCLAVVWLSSTLQAYQHIRQRDLRNHERLMIYSYSACFAAVTLRFWLPLLLGAFRLDFAVAYPIVAWLCWVPNLLVGHGMASRV